MSESRKQESAPDGELLVDDFLKAAGYRFVGKVENIVIVDDDGTEMTPEEFIKRKLDRND